MSKETKERIGFIVISTMICLILFFAGYALYYLFSVGIDMQQEVSNTLRHNEDVIIQQEDLRGKIISKRYNRSAIFYPRLFEIERSKNSYEITSVSKGEFEKYAVGDDYYKTISVTLRRIITKKGTLDDEYFIITKSSKGEFIYTLHKERYDELSVGDKMDYDFKKYIHKDHKLYNKIKEVADER